MYTSFIVAGAYFNKTIIMENDNNIRKQMESSVIAVNRHLSERVKKMSEHELLNNMHPVDAEYFTHIR